VPRRRRFTPPNAAHPVARPLAARRRRCDAGNAVAGRPDAVALGQRLFFDPRLSPDGRLACASCHVPALAFADGRARSQGREPLDRNAPSLWNAVHERWWAGTAPPTACGRRRCARCRTRANWPADPGTCAAWLAGDADLACRWRRSFGAPPPADDERAAGADRPRRWAPSSAAWCRRRRRSTAFATRWRAATGGGGPLPGGGQRGLQLFVGRGRCQLCHAGPRFSNGEFADIGAGFFVRPGVVDPGRHGGIQACWAAAPQPAVAACRRARRAGLKTRHVQLQHRNFGEFKVPSLRNVAQTAPYLHDGQWPRWPGGAALLELNLDRLHADGERILEPLQLTPAEAADLLAFLRRCRPGGPALAARGVAPVPVSAEPPCRGLKTLTTRALFRVPVIACHPVQRVHTGFVGPAADAFRTRARTLPSPLPCFSFPPRSDIPHACRFPPPLD
jgi:cytochrome c peroxidase